MLTETQLEKHLRKYLAENGWVETNDLKSVGQHGCDITAWHPKRRKLLLIEAKGGGGQKNKNQTIHNSFYTLLGQILSRMDKEGNEQKKARTYAIAIPSTWEIVYRKKIKQMPYGWSLLKLRVFLVKDSGDVEEKTYRQFLK